jgi:hypothetical protein
MAVLLFWGLVFVFLACVLFVPPLVMFGLELVLIFGGASLFLYKECNSYRARSGESANE